MSVTMVDRILEILQDFCPLANQSHSNLRTAMFADVIKVANQWTLKQGACLDYPGKPNTITWDLRSRWGRQKSWSESYVSKRRENRNEAKGGRKRSEVWEGFKCHCWLLRWRKGETIQGMAENNFWTTASNEVGHLCPTTA